MTLRTRLRLGVYGAFAVVGTIAAVLIAIGVAPAAKTSLDVALLGFACAAAVSGYLGLIVGWLGYRLEAGRVPKPDVAILDRGNTTKRWDVEITLLAADDASALAAAVARETRVMEASIAELEKPRANRKSNLIMDFDVSGHISDDAMAKYRAEVSEYLEDYEERLRIKRAFDAVLARSREVIFAFTNDRAGVPADGVRAIIHIPDEVDLIKRSAVPKDPGMPARPKPPRARSLFGSLSGMSRGFDTSLLSSLSSVRPMPALGRPRNVSSPTIRSGSSTEIEFTVGEILHNVREDSHEDPVVLVFPRAATWTIRYEVHARNLPNPKRGELTITTTAKAPPVADANGY